VDRYSQRTEISAEVASDLHTDQRLRRELETACFRIVQEALTNIARHARATRVSVQLKLSHNALLLVVRDDGVGFDARRLLKHGFPLTTMGLRGMEERALAVGGDLKIGSAPDRGTEIHASFPL
jgi:signal transduction histidine kinase